VAIECAGLQATLDQVLSLSTRDGRVVLVAHFRQVPEFDFEAFSNGSRSLYRPMGTDPFIEEAVGMLDRGEVDLAQLVSHRFPLENAEEAFETACDASRSVKVLFTP